MSEVRMLTIRQPWAWAIAEGGKTIENRPTSTSYRSLVAIHAGQRYDRDADDDPRVEDAMRRWMGRATPLGVPPWQQGGRIIAVSELDSVCSASATSEMLLCGCGPWARPGAHHWHLNATVPIVPLAATGWLGLRPLPADVAAEVERRWGDALTQWVGLS